MPYAETNGANIYYEDVGEGFPVFLIAPGGMKSSIDFWRGMAWNPIVKLADKYRVIAMDQRNAGQSSAPVSGSDGWSTYTSDQLGLMDALGVDRFHVMGMCIGGPYAMGLIEAAPERVASAVLFQSIGLMNGGSNRNAFYDMFDSWAEPLAATKDASAADWQQFRSNMYDGDDFLFNVDDRFVKNCVTPLCILEGNDLYHPQETSQRIRALAPNHLYIEHWKDDDSRGGAMREVENFLLAHSGTTP